MRIADTRFLSCCANRSWTNTDLKYKNILITSIELFNHLTNFKLRVCVKNELYYLDDISSSKYQSLHHFSCYDISGLKNDIRFYLLSRTLSYYVWYHYKDMIYKNSLTIIVWEGNSFLTFSTNSTKNCEYPFATSRQMKLTPSILFRISHNLLKSPSAVPAEAATYGKASGCSAANFFQSSNEWYLWRQV